MAVFFIFNLLILLVNLLIQLVHEVIEQRCAMMIQDTQSIIVQLHYE